MPSGLGPIQGIALGPASTDVAPDRMARVRGSHDGKVRGQWGRMGLVTGHPGPSVDSATCSAVAFTGLLERQRYLFLPRISEEPMILPLNRGTPAFVLAAMILAACTSAPVSTGSPSPDRTTIEQANQAAIDRARADSARLPYTEADVHFMTAMIGHHAQAITISRWARTHGASPAVVTLAERIINGQQDEIGTMQRWLRDRLKPVPEPDTSAAGMHHPSGQGAAHHGAAGGMQHGAAQGAAGATQHGTGAAGGMQHGTAHGAAGHMSMPGMLSEAQLAQLGAARGAEFDRLYLAMMIQHHRGAVTMVEQLFSSYGAAQDETVFKFASDVNVDQITEIARMERMLAAMLFETPGR